MTPHSFRAFLWCYNFKDGSSLSIPVQIKDIVIAPLSSSTVLWFKVNHQNLAFRKYPRQKT
jgi:hypothetical protein